MVIASVRTVIMYIKCDSDDSEDSDDFDDFDDSDDFMQSPEFSAKTVMGTGPITSPIPF